ncbi:MotA/TolQ/ExbB proton channel family protein [Aestuariibaculum sp. M13]|uniref:MotA/TolQ/ExbB proton channel family protein n=1 Tax=Aestuariibaculum sp. M13 TaxID=2967132 RepID=UPI00215A0456|nr:MotA/TolQ/ExbB proton channel family protein [Aestuariibaculum sp. M13]MCR8666223.1 MotA/TolQ/ExbB proton channel family protein [Aestuariibaculum sp. M13]
MHEIVFFNISEEVLVFVCKKLPWIVLLIWFLYSFSMLAATKYFQRIRVTNYFVLENIPSIFVTLGLLGTFLGITYGLIHFDTSPKQIKNSISLLLDGLKTAFYTSIFGIFCSLLFKMFLNYKFQVGAIVHPDDLKEQDISLSINNNLIAIREQTKLSLDALVDIKDKKLKNISDGTDGLQKKLDKFFEDMAQQSAGAIQEALMSIIEDFNETFKTFIGQLVEKNFELLTESINQLITWQKEYKGEIVGLKEAYNRLAENHKDFVNNTENWISKLDAIAGSSSQLQNIINDFQSAFDDESRFSDVIRKINESVDSLHATSGMVNKHTEQLSQTSIALENTKDEVSDWLNKEEGVRDMVVALSESLKELRQFDISQIEDLDKLFNKKIENTFKGMDDLFTTQLKYINGRLKNN